MALKNFIGRPRPCFFQMCGYENNTRVLENGSVLVSYGTFGVLGSVSKCQGTVCSFVFIRRVEEQRIQRVSLLPLRPFRYLHKCDRDASASPLPVHRLLLLVAAVCHSRYQNGDVPAVGDLDVLHSRQSHCAYVIASVIPSSITGTDRRMWWVEWSSVR